MFKETKEGQTHYCERCENILNINLQHTCIPTESNKIGTEIEDKEWELTKKWYEEAYSKKTPLHDKFADFVKGKCLNPIREIISKYDDAKEIEIKGKRYLQFADGKKKPFGYPYQDTKEKYIISEILEFLINN